MSQDRLMLDFVYHSQKIEGCKLTYEETEKLCFNNTYPFNVYKADIPTEKLVDTIETLSMYNLYKFVTIEDDSGVLPDPNILMWHKYIFNSTKERIAGTLRTYNVYIKGANTRFPDYTMVKRLYSNFEKWLGKSLENLDTDIEDFAFKAHFRLVRLHPFGDGNGRISRFLMNVLLNITFNPPMIIKYEDRYKYYEVLELEDELEFVKWCKKYYVDSYMNIIEKK